MINDRGRFINHEVYQLCMIPGYSGDLVCLFGQEGTSFLPTNPVLMGYLCLLFIRGPSLSSIALSHEAVP